MNQFEWDYIPEIFPDPHFSRTGSGVFYPLNFPFFTTVRQLSHFFLDTLALEKSVKNRPDRLQGCFMKNNLNLKKR